jgi:hypothetical protein
MKDMDPGVNGVLATREHNYIFLFQTRSGSTRNTYICLYMNIQRECILVIISPVESELLGLYSNRSTKHDLKVRKQDNIVSSHHFSPPRKKKFGTYISTRDDRAVYGPKEICPS